MEWVEEEDVGRPNSLDLDQEVVGSYALEREPIHVVELDIEAASTLENLNV